MNIADAATTHQSRADCVHCLRPRVTQRTLYAAIVNTVINDQLSLDMVRMLVRRLLSRSVWTIAFHVTVLLNESSGRRWSHRRRYVDRGRRAVAQSSTRQSA